MLTSKSLKQTDHASAKAQLNSVARPLLSAGAHAGLQSSGEWVPAEVVQMVWDWAYEQQGSDCIDADAVQELLLGLNVVFGRRESARAAALKVRCRCWSSSGMDTSVHSGALAFVCCVCFGEAN